MFQSARFKLTTWYLLIIMLVSIMFSLAIYHALTFEIERIQRIQQLRQEFPQGFRRSRPFFQQIDPEVLEESKQRLRLTLVLINVFVLGVSGVSGYFLAGRTLKPIKLMVDEQHRFITDASHELRTPITAMKTATEVALRGKKLTVKEAKDLLKENLYEIDNLQRLSDNLLRLAQYEKVNGNSMFSEISLANVLQEAKKRVDFLAKSKKIHLKIPETKIALSVEKDSLIELVVILLDNAIKYSPQGTSVEVTVSQTDGELLLIVSDQGFGIETKDLPHIFDRFYRADKARSKDTVSGYGLGLSIAKKIVDLQHGSIAVESVVGQGTKFTVKMPVRWS